MSRSSHLFLTQRLLCSHQVFVLLLKAMSLDANEERACAEQVAEQQGKYMARCLNDMARGNKEPFSTPFVFHSMSGA